MISIIFMLSEKLTCSVLPFRKEMSAYYLEHASVNHLQKHFDLFEAEAQSLLGLGLPIPVYVSSYLCLYFVLRLHIDCEFFL